MNTNTPFPDGGQRSFVGHARTARLGFAGRRTDGNRKLSLKTNRMEFPVTKSELVQSIADSARLSKQEAERALAAVVSAITTGVASGEKVVLPGLGTFERRDRAAREGRNPRSGETIQIAASTVPGFKAAAAFKAAVAAE